MARRHSVRSGRVDSFAHSRRSGATIHDPLSVAYVNTNRVLADSTHGRTQLTRLQTLQQQKSTELRTKQQALEATRTKLAQAADRAARAPLAQQEQQQRQDFERSTQQAQADIQALQREVNADLQSRVKGALVEMVKTQNFQLVLNSDTSVVWSSPGLDVTAAVVQRLNAK